MAYKRILALVVILFSIKEARTQTLVTVTTPQGQEAVHVAREQCAKTSLSLNFQKVGLRRVNSDFAHSPNVSCLSLEDNEIDQVSPSAFRLLPGLSYLNLARNKISLADLSDLDGHLHLRTLILDENNQDSQQSPGILEFKNAFPSLLHLHLRANNIYGVKSLAFAPSLVHLDLSSNSLWSSNLGFLDDVATSLELLDLRNNNLTGLRVGKLVALRELQVSGNRITRVCGKSYCDSGSALILEGARSLRRLDLANNGLSSLEPDAFDDALELEELNLAHNRLDVIRKHTFEAFGNSTRLRNLSLADNLLLEIPDLSDLTSLQILSLAGNRLVRVDNASFANLPLLRELDLSGNQIESLEAAAFSKQFFLEVLKLSNNLLAKFAYLWLLPVSRLRVLHLDGNRIEKLDDLKLAGIRLSSNLERIYLQNNLITEFRSGYLYKLRPLPNITLELFDASAETSEREDALRSDAACKCNCNESDELANLI